MLSLKLYKSEQSSSPTATKPAEKDESKTTAKTSQESESTANNTATTAETSTAGKQEEGGRDPFEGLDDITKTCFEVCIALVTSYWLIWESWLVLL